MENTNEAKIIKFEDKKTEILSELNTRINDGRIKLSEKTTLIDGFINQLITIEISNTFTLGGPSIPMVALVGESGQLYFFALKAILPSLWNN